MIPKIKRAEGWERHFGKWKVSNKNNTDIVRTFGHAIRFWLWYVGVPAKVAFWNL